MIKLLIWVKAKIRLFRFFFSTSWPVLFILYSNKKIREVLYTTKFFFKHLPVCSNEYIREMKIKCASAGNKYHIGTEHPLLSQYIAHILIKTKSMICLEIGYQCGGLTIPAALALTKHNANTLYFGIDNQEDEASKGNRKLILDYLKGKGIKEKQIHLYVGDANELIETCFVKYTPPICFDTVIIDHRKSLYLNCFKLLEKKGLISERSIIFFHDIFTYARREWGFLKKIPDYHWVEIPYIEGGLGLGMKRIYRSH